MPISMEFFLMSASIAIQSLAHAQNWTIMLLRHIKVSQHIETRIFLKYILLPGRLRAFSCLLLPGDKQLYDYIEKAPECGPRGHKCTLCGKVGNDRGNLRKHVENVHFPGTFSYQCRHCPPPAAIFPTRTKLNNHMSAMHKNLPF